MNHKGSPNGPPAGNAVVNVANEEVRPDLKTISKQEVDKSSAELPVNGFCRKESKDLDRAQKYILDHQTSNISPVDLQALRRKIDWRIVPIMACCYTMQFVDKVLLNVGDQSVYAAVMGLPKQIGLVGNNFSNTSSALFIAYLIAEMPNGLILQQISAPKWLGINVILWGIATGCTAAAYSYHTLLVARIFLGVFEAALSPSLTLISSQWYTKSEQAPRFSVWFIGVGLGQITGGIVSYAFQHVKHETIAGWQIMFVILGLVTVIVGIATIFIIPDTPMDARFLSDAEKLALLHHVSINRTGIQNKNFKFSQLLEILVDPQMWLLTILTILIAISSGVITTYSATLIRNLGFSSPIAALLNIPSGLVSIMFALGTGFAIRHTSNRWAWIVVCCVPGIIGGALMSFLPVHNRGGVLAGIYMVNAITATLVIIFQWTASNVAGQTKRVASVALIAGSFSVGNIIGPQTFQAKDAPQYTPAKIIVLTSQAGAAFFAIILFVYYSWANKRKASAVGVEATEVDNDRDQGRWDNITDRKNMLFRYVY